MLKIFFIVGLLPVAIVLQIVIFYSIYITTRSTLSQEHRKGVYDSNSTNDAEYELLCSWTSKETDTIKNNYYHR